jgi:hypothetical protein
MLKTVFVWLFIAVPLASAIGLIGYRMRTFLLVLGLIILGAAGIWGTLRLGSALDGWWNGTPADLTPPPCLEQATHPSPAAKCGV